MKRWCVLMFGLATYGLFLAVFLYAVGFLGNFGVPKTLDASAGDASLPAAIGIDLLLVLLFALQHSVMARPGFKRWWTRIVPGAVERNVYVLATVGALALLFWQWRPIGGVVWEVTSVWGTTVLYGLFACGWITVLISTFLINHFDLFGLRQAWLYFRGRPYTPLRFVTPGPYRLVRHPLYVGWLLVFWATPTMTVAHLLFALGMTVYILVAIRFEERDLIAYHGVRYEDYRRRVPMLIPRLRAATRSETTRTLRPLENQSLTPAETTE